MIIPCGLKHIGIINNIHIKGRKLCNLLVEWCDWLLTMHGINNINFQWPLLPLAGQCSQHFPWSLLHWVATALVVPLANKLAMHDFRLLLQYSWGLRSSGIVQYQWVVCYRCFSTTCQFSLQGSRCPNRSSATSHMIKDFKCYGCYNLVMSYKEEVPLDLSHDSSDNDQICYVGEKLLHSFQYLSTHIAVGGHLAIFVHTIHTGIIVSNGKKFHSILWFTAEIFFCWWGINGCPYTILTEKYFI